MTRGRSSVARTTALAAGLAGALAFGAAPASATIPGWGFEQVTPPVKGEGTVGAVDGFRAAQDGNTFLYMAKSPFSSVPTESSPQYVRYLGTRGENGWTSVGVDPPMGIPGWASTSGVLASSENLRYVLVASMIKLTPGATQDGGNLYVRDTRTLAYTLVATSPDPELARQASNPFGQSSFPYVANDGKGVAFMAANVSLDPDIPAGSGTAYVWTADRGLEVVSVLPDGTKVAGGYFQTGETGTRDPFPRDLHALDHVYFTAPDGAVYVRSGSTTRLVSRSHVGAGSSTPVQARWMATGAGGKVAVFQTNWNVALTADTPPTPAGGGSNIYRYDWAADALTYIGPGGAFYDDSVQHMTEDGATIAFRSGAALHPDAVENEANFYVSRDGQVKYVQTADPFTTATSGAQFLRLLSPNGRYFAYTDDSPSVAQRFGVDTVTERCPPAYSSVPGPCAQVYLFDADAANEADALKCASCRPDLSTPRGHSGDPWDIAGSGIGFARHDQRQPQTVTDDGTVFFTSADDIVAGDHNGDWDVYRYHAGKQELVSRGTPGARSRFLDATRDGKTVFFTSGDRIVPTDTDRALDVYMTRLGAGFPFTPVETGVTCSGADCREGGGAVVAPPPVAGTVTFSGPGNAAEDAAEPKRATASVRRIKTVRGTRATLRVKVDRAGQVRVSGNGLRRKSSRAKKASTVKIAVRLSAHGARKLRKKRTLRVRATVRFTPKAGATRTVRVPVTFKLATTKKGR